MKRAVKQMLPVYVLSFLANVVSAIVILRYGMSYSGQWEFFYKRVIFVIFSVVTSLLICVWGTQRLKKIEKERIVNGRLFGLYDPSCIYCDLGVS